jgi:imidazolonepropionase
MRSGVSAYGLIEDAALLIEGGKVCWCGHYEELPDDLSDLCNTEPNVKSLGGRLITPALIDCHTHLVFGGDRAAEFEMRLKGASYQDIAQAGGGILSTVKATRASDEQTLLKSALRRLDHLLDDGVAIVEIKSGYGLTIEDELRMLRVARQLEQHRAVKIVTTWLAAHTLPTEFKGRADDYIDTVVLPGLERASAEGLVDAVDGFCESIAFSPAQIERVFKQAKALNIPIKLHAEQLSDLKGAVLAAEYGALSADHLEYLQPEDVAPMKAAGTAAVLLPGAFYFLRETQLPPVQALRDHNVDIAIATDCNPGSSPLSSLLTAMNMACTLFRLTPEEALIGTTRAAANALGLGEAFGTIEQGKKAALAIWNVESPAELSYWVGSSPLYQRVV